MMRIGKGNYQGKPVFFIVEENGLGILSGDQDSIMAGDRQTEMVVSPDKIEVRNPISPPNIYCLAKNYPEHAAESGASATSSPQAFLKPVSSISWTGKPLELPWFSNAIDYEAELVCVIGKAAHNISRKNALDYVFGYTVGNDISDRYHQYQSPLGFMAKGYPGFAPIGPYVLTADEFEGPPDLAIQMRLNGKTMQNARTSEMNMKVPEIIEFLSRYYMLLPGDLIFTGTPSGPGHFRKPPTYLKAGDEMECEIEKIGILRNKVLSPVQSAATS